jgi:hypothetical protein
MKKPSVGLALAAVIVLLATAMAGSSDSQTAERAKAAAAPPRYDAGKEVVIEGVVSSVITKPTPGMLAGAHALLTTASGTVDAHLGNYAMKGTPRLRLYAGEHVRMVGVIVTIQDRPVLLVRTAQTSGGTYTVRNANGILTRSASARAIRPLKGLLGGGS